MLWQRTLCESLGLKGRILISEHGINGTVGGDMEACKRYVRQTKEYPGFKRMQFNCMRLKPGYSRVWRT